MTVTYDWLALTPVLAPVAGLLLVIIADAVRPATAHRPLVWLGLVGLLAGLAAALRQVVADQPVRTLCTEAHETGACLYTPDRLGSVLQAGVLAAAVGALLLLSPSLGGVRGRPARVAPVVPVTLVLAAAAGAAALGGATDLATWLIALELATLPVVALVGLRGTRRSAGGALTFLLTALLSFALLAVGVALWLLATGSPALAGGPAASAWSDPARRPMLVLAVLVLLAGLGFKLSLVPFHSWTPQVFATAGVPVTALLASLSKLAAVVALVRLIAPLTDLPGDHPHVLAVALGSLGLVAMVLGASMALRQGDLMRLLAWSTVGQSGWTVLPLVGLGVTGLRATVPYALVYAAASLLAFGAIAWVHSARGSVDPEVRLGAYRGLLRDHPLTGGALAFALLVLAGLPPGVIGLVTKIVALRAVVEAGLWPLAVGAVVAAVIGLAAYARVIAVLLMPRRAGEPALLVRPGRGPLVMVLLALAALVLLSVTPNLLFGLL